MNKINWLDFNHNIILNEGNHAIVKTTNKNLYGTFIENWKFNRPPDRTRIPEIIKTYETATFLDGIIYLFKQENTYVCYDGIHRISALSGINDNCVIIIDILNQPDEKLVKEIFFRINKTIPVPLLYSTPEAELEMRIIIENVVKIYCDKYKAFFSSSRKPQIPNENRDAMMDKLYEFSEECLESHFWTEDEWISLLGARNIFIKNNLKKLKIKLSKNQLSKCQKYDFYLFATKKWNFLN